MISIKKCDPVHPTKSAKRLGLCDITNAYNNRKQLASKIIKSSSKSSECKPSINSVITEMRTLRVKNDGQLEHNVQKSIRKIPKEQLLILDGIVNGSTKIRQNNDILSVIAGTTRDDIMKESGCKVQNEGKVPNIIETTESGVVKELRGKLQNEGKVSTIIETAEYMVKESLGKLHEDGEVPAYTETEEAMMKTRLYGHQPTCNISSNHQESDLSQLNTDMHENTIAAKLIHLRCERLRLRQKDLGFKRQGILLKQKGNLLVRKHTELRKKVRELLTSPDMQRDDTNCKEIMLNSFIPNQSNFESIEMDSSLSIMHGVTETENFSTRTPEERSVSNHSMTKTIQSKTGERKSRLSLFPSPKPKKINILCSSRHYGERIHYV